MKKSIYTFISAVIIMAMTVSCEDLTDAPSNVPVITTGDVCSLSIHSALIKKTVPTVGTVYKGYEYVMIDTLENFPNQIYVSKMEEYSNDSILWICENLFPNKKYYYRQCASDGLEYVYGETKSFTTAKAIGVGSVKVVDGDGGSTSTTLPDGDLGVFVVDQNGNCTNSNVQVTGNSDGSSWSVSSEVTPSGGTSHMYVYSPYDSNNKDTDVYVAVYKYNTDFMYGSSDIINKDNPDANITMHHAMADVVFSVKRAEGDNVGASISSLYIRYADGKDSIKAYGYFNIVSGQWDKIGYMDFVTRNFTAFTPDTKTATDIDVSMIPATYGEGKLTVSLGDYNFSTSAASVTLPAIDWKAGYRYVYPVTVYQTKLVIGDVQVEPWINNDGGNINITK